MQPLRRIFAVLVLWSLTTSARAGLYYSDEPIAELPSQWRGFLLDQRTLRNLAVKPNPAVAPNPLRVKYEAAAAQLEKASREKKLTADELADLGALYVRLGETAKAVALLRTAQRDHPNHFRIVANLGTAWQLHGDLGQAAACLQQAVRLAPGKLQKAEEQHLRLVRLRQREKAGAQDLDDLFGIRFVGESGRYEPGKLAAAQSKKLPSDAVALTQQVALWLPADARLLWQLAELANAHGDVKTAAAIMDGCVTEFGLHAPELRQHRQLVRAAADQLAKDDEAGGARMNRAHEGSAGVIRPRSKRPLLNQLDTAKLPAINATGVNHLPWAVLAETTVDRQYKPTFAKYLRELDGKQVSLTGFMQPLNEELEVGSFMLIEYPVGCWYCEMPEMTGIILVELPGGKTTNFRRSSVKVEGQMTLNATDPENFLYIITKAKVSETD
jgi:tetratricopeptide (TPR) repeat protein